MSEITLTRSFVHDYDGPDGKELYNFDVKMIRHVLRLGNRNFGWLEFIVDEVGTSCYERVRIIYDGEQIFSAQETRNGDWLVNCCKLPVDSKTWEYIFKVG